MYQKGQIKATGQADAAVEKVLSAYAVEGVQFTGLRVGDMEVYSKTVGDQTEVQLVYEIPEKLRKILGLESKDAVDMGQRGLKYVCHTADVRHYTATQLSKALINVLRISVGQDLEHGLRINRRISSFGRVSLIQ